MTLKARFCTYCAGPLEERDFDGRVRRVCRECGSVAYQNPLPVVSCVVVNDKGEVLLVKRGNEPQKGMWCLPTGFAEAGETIADAALRELKEETGILGRVLRFLGTFSDYSSMYGDLLSVSFEIEKVSGEERAGDDAVDVAYFPMDALPPIAFRAHTETLGIARDFRAEGWVAGDSFHRLDAHGSGSRGDPSA